MNSADVSSAYHSVQLCKPWLNSQIVQSTAVRRPDVDKMSQRHVPDILGWVNKQLTSRNGHVWRWGPRPGRRGERRPGGTFCGLWSCADWSSGAGPSGAGRAGQKLVTLWGCRLTLTGQDGQFDQMRKIWETVIPNEDCLVTERAFFILLSKGRFRDATSSYYPSQLENFL